MWNSLFMNSKNNPKTLKKIDLHWTWTFQWRYGIPAGTRVIIGDCDGEASGQEREGVHPPIKGNYIIGSKFCSLQKKEGYLAQKQPNMPPNQHLWSVQTRKLASPAYLLLYLTKKRRNKNYPTQSKFHRKYQNQSHFPPQTDAFVHSWPFPAIWAIGAISVAKSTQKWCLGGFMKWEHQDVSNFP